LLSNKTKAVNGAVVILIHSAYIDTVNMARRTTRKNSLIGEEAAQPDSLDIAVTYKASGWEIVGQERVALNGSSVTSYVGRLATDWTVSPDGMTYTLNSGIGVTSSNGDNSSPIFPIFCQIKCYFGEIVPFQIWYLIKCQILKFYSACSLRSFGSSLVEDAD